MQRWRPMQTSSPSQIRSASLPKHPRQAQSDNLDTSQPLSERSRKKISQPISTKAPRIFAKTTQRNVHQRRLESQTKPFQGSAHRRLSPRTVKEEKSIKTTSLAPPTFSELQQQKTIFTALQSSSTRKERRKRQPRNFRLQKHLTISSEITTTLAIQFTISRRRRLQANKKKPQCSQPRTSAENALRADSM